MLHGWEGNRRSGVALAMDHGLTGLPTYGLIGLRKGEEHPAYAPLGYGTFTFTLHFLSLQHSYRWQCTLNFLHGVLAEYLWLCSSYFLCVKILNLLLVFLKYDSTVVVFHILSCCVSLG